jgi:two-component system nitrogen regulation sensor histidine kinase NtrY
MTTKEHGTGLGLAIVKRMIEDHHGFIRAFSEPNSETQFIVELPVDETAAAPESRLS